MVRSLLGFFFLRSEVGRRESSDSDVFTRDVAACPGEFRMGFDSKIDERDVEGATE